MHLQGTALHPAQPARGGVSQAATMVDQVEPRVMMRIAKERVASRGAQ